MAIVNIPIGPPLWKIRKTMKLINFLNTSLIKIIAETYENISLVSEPRTVAVIICYTCLSFHIENVRGFTGNW